MQPLVSILIPCYNVEKWLADTIESTLAQTWKNIEVILVDDGSKDNTLAVAQRYASSNVKVICQNNQGQSAAENRAFREAQGDFIEYLDADDLLAPDKIERQVQLLGDSHSGFVAAGEWARFYNSPDDALFVPHPLWADMDSVDWLLCAWENSYMMHGAAWLIPRKIAERAGSWTEELSLINDFDYFSRVLLASQGVKFCWGARTYYRSGGMNNLSASKSDTAWKSAFRSFELGTSSLLARENSPRTRRVCATVFQHFIYDVYPEASELSQKAAVRVQELGGSSLKPSGGPGFQLISRVLGWQRAKHIQRLLYRYGYSKVAIGWKLTLFIQRLTYHSETRKDLLSGSDMK